MLNSENPKALMDPNMDIKFNDDQVQRVVLAATLCINASARLRPNASEVKNPMLLLFRFCHVKSEYIYVLIVLGFNLLLFARSYWFWLENFGIYKGKAKCTPVC